VARILGDGKRQRTRVFTELQSHYLFEDRFGRPGKGNDKGKVEGLVGYARRNFLVPIPVFESFEAGRWWFGSPWHRSRPGHPRDRAVR
jgi:transposase